ncbi:membrane protein [Jannaschia pagri]|uniref:High-affinity zinc uptake system membrane protein ZnuB n=1 Tax=Jannaschia pagri TaxID=2829797 RepID=A0ABQ4NH91_9RHOB|nr:MULTISPECIES: metal ABC transporter permease [unclassified Jannaschia]GIT90096.1 membrane protein [Jannaschia sp. AI_61]GIT93798.1 membrane protein [Jannaschia sp. AI_62]
MLDDFMVRATLAGVGVACAAAPLGCFVVWRRMAYFGDATAHAAMLGVALSLALQTSVFVGTVAVALAMAVTVTVLSGRGYGMDTLLGVLAHSALAAGLVAVSFLSGVRLDLMAYLFGDLLAVGRLDLAVIWGGAALVVVLLAWRWSALLLSTLNEELARASDIDPRREEMFLTVALAITVAVAIKVVGVLLIAAMLIVPAAAARGLSRTPEVMAILAGAIGSFSTVAGLRAAYVFDTPAGPSIVCVAAACFLAVTLATGVGRRGARRG